MKWKERSINEWIETFLRIFVCKINSFDDAGADLTFNTLDVKLISLDFEELNMVFPSKMFLLW